jgi:hypothetical protein
MDTNKIAALRKVLYDDLFVGVPATEDFGDRLALVGMICYLTNAFHKKNPNLTHYDVIKLCTKDLWVDNDQLIALSLICEFFSYDCKKFPNFGLSPKEMAEKCGQLISQLCPF